jgi:hypothetical protein
VEIVLLSFCGLVALLMAAAYRRRNRYYRDYMKRKRDG